MTEGTFSVVETLQEIGLEPVWVKSLQDEAVLLDEHGLILLREGMPPWMLDDIARQIKALKTEGLCERESESDAAV